VIWAYVVLALVADGLAGLAGGLLSERRLRQHQAVLIAFAAGTLLSAAFVDVLPEAVERLGSIALPYAFLAFVGFAILEWLLGHHHHKGLGRSPSTLPVSLLSSDALHNMADGAALASGFLVSPRIGVMVALAIVAHEVPQEVGDYALLRAAGLSRSRALLSLVTVQLTAAIGAVVVILGSNRLHSATGIVLSLAGGTFVYIGATDLLPEVHSGDTHGDRRQRLAGFLCGVLLIVPASLRP
jgi:zinc and cadmium transporter